MSRKRTGVIMTSIICSGTCLILSMPRQPNVIAADTRPACGGRAPEASAACRRSSGGRVSTCVMPPPAPSPRSLALPFAVFVLRRVAGQREEHLVEARLREREAREADVGVGQRGDRPRGLVGVGDRQRERGGIRLFVRV